MHFLYRISLYLVYFITFIFISVVFKPVPLEVTGYPPAQTTLLKPFLFRRIQKVVAHQNDVLGCSDRVPYAPSMVTHMIIHLQLLRERHKLNILVFVPAHERGYKGM